jgi:hypothetical protein
MNPIRTVTDFLNVRKQRVGTVPTTVADLRSSCCELREWLTSTWQERHEDLLRCTKLGRLVFDLDIDYSPGFDRLWDYVVRITGRPFPLFEGRVTRREAIQRVDGIIAFLDSINAPAVAVAAASTAAAEPAPPVGRSRMKVGEANDKAMKLAGEMRDGFFALSGRQQAKMIGCSWATWTKTDFYVIAQDKRPGGKRQRVTSPKTLSLTAEREAVTGEGGKDEVLQKLIEEQEADNEPSPLMDRPRRIHSRKRL